LDSRALVREIGSVSHCIAKPFADDIDYWAHDGMWLFDSAQAIFKLVAREGLSPPAARTSSTCRNRLNALHPHARLGSNLRL